MKFARLPLVAVLVVGGGVAGAQPAHAGETHSFRTVGDGRGYAKAAVTVDFLSKTTVDLKGWVRDVCPGDGKGAYVSISYLTQYWSYGTVIGKDTNGCGSTSVGFDPAPVVKGSRLQSLRAVRITVCERDADGGGGSWCDSHHYDNWRVG